MNDAQTTVLELRRLVERFVSERDWHCFHTPKNLSASIAIEAAELMEHFQWLTAEQSRALPERPEKLAAVGEEMADVLAYLLAMANELNIDLAAALEAKMVHNGKKYPAAEYRGRFGVNS